MLPEWANLISSYSLSDNLDWSPSPLCRWTEPETNVLSLFCFNLQTLWWRRVAQTSMGVLASQTGQMQNELWQLQGQIWENWIPWQQHLRDQAIPILEPVETPKWSFGSCAKKSRMQRNFASDGGWEGQRLLCRCQGRCLHIWKSPVIKRWST